VLEVCLEGGDGAVQGKGVDCQQTKILVNTAALEA
jgi:hypothetical protein